MLVGQQLGFSITSPFKKVGSVVKSGAKVVYKAHAIPTKYAVKATTTTAKYAGKGAVVAGKAVYKAHAIPTKWLLVKPTVWLTEKATAPVKSRVQKIVSRRARKLAWDRRKSKTPTPAEHSEARTWTRNRLLALTPIVPAAPLLAVFAGAPVLDSQLGANPYVIAAVPVLMAAAAAILSQLSKSGEAPENPEGGGGALAPPPPPGADGGPPPQPGEVDLTPVQDQAAMAMDQGAEAMQQAADQAAGRQRVGGMRLPAGVKRSHLMIGGVLVVGLLALTMLKPKGGGRDKD